MRIDTTQLSEGEQIVVEDEIRKRVAVAVHAANEYFALQDQQKALENLVKDGEAYFARAELVHFCRSKRYRLASLNIANALAGLPLIRPTSGSNEIDSVVIDNDAVKGRSHSVGDANLPSLSFNNWNE
jgi:hypothetical protein